jgi:hypothetical protein
MPTQTLSCLNWLEEPNAPFDFGEIFALLIKILVFFPESLHKILEGLLIFPDV